MNFEEFNKLKKRLEEKEYVMLDACKQTESCAQDIKVLLSEIDDLKIHIAQRTKVLKEMENKTTVLKEKYEEKLKLEQDLMKSIGVIKKLGGEVLNSWINHRREQEARDSSFFQNHFSEKQPLPEQVTNQKGTMRIIKLRAFVWH